MNMDTNRDYYYMDLKPEEKRFDFSERLNDR